MPHAADVDWARFLAAMALALVRISGMVAFAPFFSSTALPVRTKAVFVGAVAYLLAPLVAASPQAQSTLNFSSLLGELAVGLVYGLTLTLLSEMMLFAGQIAGLQFSFSAVNLLDPTSPIQTPLLGDLFQLAGTLVVIAAGLDRILLASVVRSFRAVPLGSYAMAPLSALGKEGPLRELTDIEESILASVVEIICRELTAAWQPVGLSFNFERRQMQTQAARIMAVTEKTLCLSFEIRMPHSSGLLNLAFPAVVANTILRRLTSDWGRRRRHAGDIRGRMETMARKIRFGASLQLPTVRLMASTIEKLEPGTVLRLDLPANTLPVWQVGGQALSEAQAVRHGAHRGARLERMLAESNR